MNDIERMKELRAQSQRARKELMSSITRMYSPELEQAIASMRRIQQMQAQWQEIARVTEAWKRMVPDMSGLQAAAQVYAQWQKSLEPYRAFQEQFRNLPKVAFGIEALKAGDLLKKMSGLSQVQTLLQEIDKTAREIKEGHDALDASGFKHTVDLLTVNSLRTLKLSEDARGRTAITNQMLAMTRTKSFGEDLEAVLKSSPRGTRRVGVIRQAYRCHCRREYFVSVPALTAQVEGLLTDLLGILEVYIWHEGQWVVRDGKVPKLDKSGKVITQALGAKLTNPKVTNRKGLQFFLDFAMNSVLDSGLGRKGLKDTRNDIMHGQSVNYGKAKLSTQLVLTILVLARELADFEKDQTITKKVKTTR